MAKRFLAANGDNAGPSVSDLEETVELKLGKKALAADIEDSELRAIMSRQDEARTKILDLELPRAARLTEHQEGTQATGVGKDTQQQIRDELDKWAEEQEGTKDTIAVSSAQQDTRNKLDKIVEIKRNLPSYTLGDGVLEGEVGAQNEGLQRFTGLRIMSQGGQGVVLEARRQPDREEVIIKVSRMRDTETIYNFIREIQTTGLLNMPNVPDILEAGTLVDKSLPGVQTEQTFFFVMPKYPSDLEKEEEQIKNMSLAEKMHFLEDDILPLIETLAEFSDLDLVHRDIKESNIYRAKDGSLILADLGTAKGLEKIADEEYIIGSLPYMPPEQILDPSTVSSQADVYALGAMLYALFTGETPFSGYLDNLTMVRDVKKYMDPSSQFSRDKKLEIIKKLNLSGLKHSMISLISKMLDPLPENRPEMHNLSQKFKYHLSLDRKNIMSSPSSIARSIQHLKEALTQTNDPKEQKHLEGQLAKEEKRASEARQEVIVLHRLDEFRNNVQVVRSLPVPRLSSSKSIISIKKELSKHLSDRENRLLSTLRQVLSKAENDSNLSEQEYSEDPQLYFLYKQAQEIVDLIVKFGREKNENYYLTLQREIKLLRNREKLIARSE